MFEKLLKVHADIEKEKLLKEKLRSEIRLDFEKIIQQELRGLCLTNKTCFNCRRILGEHFFWTTPSGSPICETCLKNWVNERL